jgi:hypothetical protein
MKTIPLTKGKVAIVDEIDYHWLSQRHWYLHGDGYAKCDLFGRRGFMMKVFMHRLILLAPDTATVDHANRDTLDNRRSNLRLATMSEQNANRPKIFGASRFKGVYRRSDGRKWCAQIRAHNAPTIYLGSFEIEEEAALAYNAAALEHYGEFARLNIVEEGKETP